MVTRPGNQLADAAQMTETSSARYALNTLADTNTQLRGECTGHLPLGARWPCGPIPGSFPPALARTPSPRGMKEGETKWGDLCEMTMLM